MIDLRSFGLGDCAKCRRAPANHKVFNSFDPPIPGTDGFPDITGVWEYICDSCQEKSSAKA